MEIVCLIASLDFLSLIAEVFVDDQADRWQPGIGDPTILGWLTVALYLVAAISCWFRAERLHRLKSERSREVVFWRLLCCLLVLLAANKQLDLQTWLTQVGRDWFVANGWYEQRRSFQKAFIFGIGSLTSLGVLLLIWWLRTTTIRTRLAIVGVGLLGAFVVTRAASFHGMDDLLHSVVLGVPMNNLFEIGCIVWIFSCAAFHSSSKA